MFRRQVVALGEVLIEVVESPLLVVVGVVVAVELDQLTHARALLDQRFRETPHLAEGAVGDTGAKVGVHEQDAVSDGVEDRLQLGQRRVLVATGGGQLLLALLELGDVGVDTDDATIGGAVLADLEPAVVA